MLGSANIIIVRLKNKAPKNIQLSIKLVNVENPVYTINEKKQIYVWTIVDNKR